MASLRKRLDPILEISERMRRAVLELSCVRAGMAELVDAVALGATAARRAGSSPVPGTISSCVHVVLLLTTQPRCCCEFIRGCTRVVKEMPVSFYEPVARHAQAA